MTTVSHSSSGIVERKAISASGCLGSFFDIHRDRLEGKSNLTVKILVDKSLKVPHCVLINGSTNESRNLLRSIGIQADLRLSLLLNLAPTVGIAAYVNYNRETNERTRILYYSYQGKETIFSDDAQKNLKPSNLPKPESGVTHVITGIHFGIDVLVILQLPSDTHAVTQIDSILSKICTFLSTDNRKALIFTKEENNVLKKVANTTVYSNISTLTNIVKVSDVPQRINEIRKSPDQYRPITYVLRPIIWLYPQYNGKDAIFYVLPSLLNENIEQYILYLRTTKNNLDMSFQEHKLKLLSGCLKEQLSGAQKQWFDVKQKYNKEIERFSNLTVHVRNGQNGSAIVEKALNDKEQATLKNHIHELVQTIDDLKVVAQLISDLRKQRIEYSNVAERGVIKTDDEKSIERKLILNYPNARIICSTSYLNRNNLDQLDKLRSQLVKERMKNSSLRLIYADFSYCTYKLHNLMLLSSNPKITSSSKTFYTSVPSIIKPQLPVEAVTFSQTSTLPSPSPLTDDTINILLLGESGVGKSTFINAFVNYLAFDSLEQAESDEPTVLISVSFLITSGDDFEEHIIKFVNFDNSNNEDFDHPGQSVTQCCRSYVFSLRHSNGKKLRIIDTPGFGDTRGIDQDDRNMEHILQYINNLTHLNAICFLFKPNASRLNMFFRTCFSQLFSLFGSTAQQNIIFCFTNARSTFYTPGDTAPLLKNVLQSFPANDIPFNRANTFCFDNESFRYLVALQNGITFDNVDKQEYQKSWSTSVKESNRLLEYISTQLPVYHMHDGRQSIKHAQLEIILLIRPMLEAMRNILRNLILYETKLSDQSIGISPNPLDYSAARCLSCRPNPIKVGQFWITPDHPHKFQNECLTCSCAYDQHIPLNYVLEYESSLEKNDDMTIVLNDLCDASAEFSHFLVNIACSTKDDPFLIGLVQMIIDENDQRRNDFSFRLAEKLRTIQRNYEQRMSQIKSNKKDIGLSDIYNLMYKITKYPMVHEQIIAVKQTQEMIMEQYEYEVPKI